MTRKTAIRLATLAGAFLLIFLLLSAGCAPAAAPSQAPKPTPAATPQATVTEVPPPAGVTRVDLEILGAAQGGTGWAMCHALAAIINKFGPKWLRATGVSTRGSMDNLVTVFKNKKAWTNTIMYLSEPMVDAGVMGLKDWGFQEQVTTRPLMLSHVSTPVHPMAALNPSIKTWADLNGKKIVADKVGASKRAMTLDMFNAAGFKVEMVNVTLDEGSDLLISGQADSVLAPLQFAGAEKGIPTAGIIDLLAQKAGKLNFISIPQDVVDKASKATNISYRFMEMPPKYIDPSIDYPVSGVSDNLCWGVFPDFNDEVAYIVTKLAYEHAEEFAAYHAVGKGSGRQTMPWISSQENVKKGAMTFYNEMGLKIGVPPKPMEALKAN